MLKAASPCVPLFTGDTGDLLFHFRLAGGAERSARAERESAKRGAGCGDAVTR